MKTMKKIAPLFLFTLAVSGFASAETTKKEVSPVKKFDVTSCSIEDEGQQVFDFCSDFANKTYTRLGKPKNINFAKSYVFITFKTPVQVEGKKFEGNAYTHYYAAINPSKKQVIPFPFVVSDENLSKSIDVAVSKSRDSVCFPETYYVDGNSDLKSFGGGSSEREMCFDIAPESEFGFSPEPLTEEDAKSESTVIDAP